MLSHGQEQVDAQCRLRVPEDEETSGLCDLSIVDRSEGVSMPSDFTVVRDRWD